MKHRLLLVAGVLIFTTNTWAVESASVKPTNSQQQMPYSQEQTIQTFTKTVHGGVQHVVVKSAANSNEIKAIQGHLRQLANAFSKGDFSATERVHGADMPGLATLKSAKTDEIRFAYKTLENGAQIHYSSEYPQFVQALHEWFDAQAAAHGSSMAPGHSQHHAAPAE